MIAHPIEQDIKANERRIAPRLRTFFKGVVYYDQRKFSVECTVRELSDIGALITFDTVFTVPDDIELHIPQRQSILSARVVRREKREIGVSFEAKSSSEPSHPMNAETAERFANLENELAAMKRLLRKLEAKVLLNSPG